MTVARGFGFAAAIVLAAGCTNTTVSATSAGISVDPAALEFGTQIGGSQTTKILTVENTGLATLVISSVAIAGDTRGAFSVAATSMSQQISAGATAAIQVTYTAPATPGADAATLTITSNAATTPALAIPLTGTSIAASKLAFTQQPTNIVSGAAFSPVVTVAVEDSSGNVVANSNATVVLTPSAGALSGNSSVIAVNGIATFTNLSMALAGDYTLTAASTGLSSATSSSFTVSAGNPAQLVFTQEPPSAAQSGIAMSQPVTVTVEDASGNVVTNFSASIGMSSSGGTLTGGSAQSATNGAATFALALTGAAGNYTLTAASNGLTSGTSSSIALLAGTAAQLVFGQQPTDTAPSATISPAVTVKLEDSAGNLTTSTATVVLATTPSTTLSGTISLAAMGGVATFSDLSIATANTYTLGATSSGLTSATSSAFTIAAQAPAGLGDVAVDVLNTTLYKLKAADGTTLTGWPVTQSNCGALAVDQSDFGVYTGASSHCGTGAGAGVFKFSASGSQVWNTAYSACGAAGAYYVGNGGVAVDTASTSPGVIFAMSGYYGNYGKVSRTTGSTLWCNGTNDLGRPTIDPTNNGQSYVMTNAGSQYNYNTLYSDTTTGGQTSAASCEGLSELNPSDGTFYKGGNMATNGCKLILYQMSKTTLGAVNWSLDLSSYISSFDAVAVQPWSGGYVYVASATSSKVVVINPATSPGTVVRTFSVAIGPNYLAVNPSGGNLYVASSSTNFVYAYSPAGVLVWTSANLGGAVYYLATPRSIVGSP